MKAKYTQLYRERCPKGCLVEGNWHIKVERSGGKPSFVICSNCGALIDKVKN